MDAKFKEDLNVDISFKNKTFESLDDFLNEFIKGKYDQPDTKSKKDIKDIEDINWNIG